MRTEICSQCGKEFTSNTSCKVCPTCRADKTCLICGAKMSWRRDKYCSKKCASIGWSSNTEAHAKISNSIKEFEAKLTDSERAARSAKLSEVHKERYANDPTLSERKRDAMLRHWENDDGTHRTAFSEGCKRAKLSFWTPEKRSEFALMLRSDYARYDKISDAQKINWENMSEADRELKLSRLLENSASLGEMEVFDYIVKILPDGEVVERGNRSVLGKFELDIFIPRLKIAVEYNGRYWHCDLNKDKNYHKIKFDLCRSKGIRLIQIWDFWWEGSRDKVCDLLRSALGVNVGAVYARECVCAEVDSCVKNNFLNEHHIQGEDKSVLSVGLIYHDNLVAVMTFRKSRDNAEVELSRYAGDVVGGFSKLLKFATPSLKSMGESSITSYSDNMLFSGNVYELNGWKYVGELPPDYKVFFRGKLLHKSAWRKSEICKRFPKFIGTSHTEWEMEDMVGALRLWDCGKKKWSYQLKKKD